MVVDGGVGGQPLALQVGIVFLQIQRPQLGQRNAPLSEVGTDSPLNIVLVAVIGGGRYLRFHLLQPLEHIVGEQQPAARPAVGVLLPDLEQQLLRPVLAALYWQVSRDPLRFSFPLFIVQIQNHVPVTLLLLQVTSNHSKSSLSFCDYNKKKCGLTLHFFATFVFCFYILYLESVDAVDSKSTVKPSA